MSEREQFEAWAVSILGDNPSWRESADCELAWQSWQARAALSTAQPEASSNGDERRASVQDAIKAMRSLGVSLNDYDSDALELLTQWSEDALSAPQADKVPAAEGASEPEQGYDAAPQPARAGAVEPTDAQIDAWAVAEQFILFADPEDVRDIVRSALQKWGAAATTAATGGKEGE